MASPRASNQRGTVFPFRAFGRQEKQSPKSYTWPKPVWPKSPLAEELLDLVNKLTDCGERVPDFRLDDLIVVGDSRTGKSTILADIMGVDIGITLPYPTLCPVEIRLEHAPARAFRVWRTPQNVQIQQQPPAGIQNDGAPQQQPPAGIQNNGAPEGDLATSEQANSRIQALMGQLQGTVPTVAESIYVTAKGPDLLPITIIDLPGLFGGVAGGGDWMEFLALYVNKYMRRKNALFLIVSKGDSMEYSGSQTFVKMLDEKRADGGLHKCIAVVTYTQRASAEVKQAWVNELVGNEINSQLRTVEWAFFVGIQGNQAVQMMLADEAQSNNAVLKQMLNCVGTLNLRMTIQENYEVSLMPAVKELRDKAKNRLEEVRKEAIKEREKLWQILSENCRRVKNIVDGTENSTDAEGNTVHVGASIRHLFQTFVVDVYNLATRNIFDQVSERARIAQAVGARTAPNFRQLDESLPSAARLILNSKFDELLKPLCAGLVGDVCTKLEEVMTTELPRNLDDSENSENSEKLHKAAISKADDLLKGLKVKMNSLCEGEIKSLESDHEPRRLTEERAASRNPQPADVYRERLNVLFRQGCQDIGVWVPRKVEMFLVKKWTSSLQDIVLELAADDKKLTPQLQELGQNGQQPVVAAGSNKEHALEVIIKRFDNLIKKLETREKLRNSQN